MKINYKCEFPCGYKFEQEVILGAFDIGNYDDKGMPKECPLHGKNCPPNK